MQKYLHEFSRKSIIAPKYITTEWLKEQRLEEVRSMINHHKLKKFLGLTGCIYSDLVKVFYTNLVFDGENMWSHVKGVGKEISHNMWIAITGLKYEGLKVEKGTIEEFNKAQFYRSCMRNPLEEVKSFGVGKLAITPLILKLLIVWIITPRGCNHATFTKEDLMLLYCLINRVKVNWVFTIKNHMIKLERLTDYKLPYAILISRMLEFFEVDLEHELS